MMLDKENKSERRETENRMHELKWALIIGLLIMALSAFIIYRNLSLKRKNEKLESEREKRIQNKTTDLEMQALRAQMNPHFIFNCLSSINRFILKNKTEEASDYLTKFSRLIRMVLNNSKRSYISLKMNWKRCACIWRWRD